MSIPIFQYIHSRCFKPHTFATLVFLKSKYITPALPDVHGGKSITNKKLTRVHDTYMIL